MDWNRSETIALAKEKCTQCHGEGLRRTSRKGPANPCHCVLRGIFRACYARFRHCAKREKFLSRVTITNCNGAHSSRTWARKDEEYAADFCLVSKRTLDETEYQIFKFHFLLGADWKLCCRRLKMDRGNFFHAVYRIQQKLGRVYRELQPYALFPLDEYFGGRILKDRPPVPNLLIMPPIAARKRRPVRPPVKPNEEVAA